MVFFFNNLLTITELQLIQNILRVNYHNIDHHCESIIHFFNEKVFFHLFINGFKYFNTSTKNLLSNEWKKKERKNKTENKFKHMISSFILVRKIF